MKYSMLALISLMMIPSNSFSQNRDVFKIEIGKDYSRYSNKELRRRVWQLERAVSQLQDQVFQLAMNNQNRPTYNSNPWTCTVSAFSDMFAASGPTKASAKAAVMAKCNKKHSAMHCDDDIKCDNQ